MVLLILEDGKHGRGESRSWIQSDPGFKGTNNRGKAEGVDWLGIKETIISCIVSHQTFTRCLTHSPWR